ncbi:MAG TPA: hypothetical protein VHG72_11870 [Polyangia bacterium]|nr:hypothetical protein [Polyangia bacterium]
MRIAPPSPARSPVVPDPPAGGAARVTSFAAVLDERLGPAVEPARGAPAPTSPGPARSPAVPRDAAGPLRAMLERTLGSERQVDALLDAAARGKTFSPAQLLALQATVARYSQTVEVLSRVADRLVGAVKQAVGTQV